MALNEDWKPEIEHIKGSDLLKKKKKKVDLPPHLRLSVMKKAFAHTNEGVGDAVKKGLKRHKDAVEKKKIKNRKAVPYAALAAEHQPEGDMVEAKYEAGASNYGKMSIRNKRAVGYGGNAAPPEERRKAHAERMKKHKKEDVEVYWSSKALDQLDKINERLKEATSYKEFMKDKEQAKARLDKKISDRKDKDKLFVDIKKKGIKFYDKKGSGRIKGGRKKYD